METQTKEENDSMSEGSGSDSNPSEDNLDIEEFVKLIPKKVAENFIQTRKSLTNPPASASKAPTEVEKR